MRNKSVPNRGVFRNQVGGGDHLGADNEASDASRGVTKVWADVLVPTLGFYKIRV